MTSENAPGNAPEHGITADPEVRIPIPAGQDGATDAARSVPMGPEPPPAWFGTADAILAFLLVVLAFFLGSFAAANSDVWIHLATGKSFADGTHTFGADPFSVGSTEPWVNHSWFFDWLFYLLYQAGGGQALVVLKALGVAVLAVVLIVARQRETSRWLHLFCVLLAVLALSPRVLLQPTVVSFVFLGITYAVLRRAGAFSSAEQATDDNPRVLWVLPPLFLLWVNLDHYFILGPIAVGLCWLAVGVHRLLKLETRAPGKLLGAVFGLGLLACLANPFHVGAFVLPPELAYVGVQAANVVGVPLPDALFAGGKTLHVLQAHDPQMLVTRSPMTGWYATHPSLGFHLAGLSFYLLFVLGLASFILAGLVSNTAGAPVLHPARFLVWLFFAVLAISQYRLIPFFAIVAGPLTALTLGELGAWFGRPREGVPAPSSALPKLGRLFGVPVLLLLLALGWPGWLNAPMEFSSARHVGWDLAPDGSLQKAAETLRALKTAGECENVFNVNIDVAHYCTWFAPEVRCFLDHRYHLFPRSADAYAKAKAALLDKDRPSSDWTSLFVEREIDHVVLPNPASVPNVEAWMMSDRWAQRFGDSRAVVFGWSGPTRRWPPGMLVGRWNELAFGKVPAEYRAPTEARPPPQQAPTFFEQYAAGVPPLPQPVQEADFLNRSYQLGGELWRVPGEPFPFLAFTSAVPSIGLPGGGVAFQQFANALRASDMNVVMTPSRMRKGFNYRGEDAGPAALPVLMVRLARQAVADLPEDGRCYLPLFNAYNLASRHEDYWVGGQSESMRAHLRRMQVINALRTVITLRPEAYELHLVLGDLYLQQHFLDLALESFLEAEKRFEDLRPTDRKALEAFLEEKRRLEDRRKLLAVDVNKRQSDYELKAATRKGLDRFKLAVHQPYTQIDAQNKESVDPQGRGLAGQALKVLQSELDLERMTPDEKYVAATGQIDLLLRTGRAAEVAEVLPSLKEVLGPGYHRIRFYAAGVLGRYGEMQESLAEIEKQLAEQLRNSFAQAVSTAHFTQMAPLGQSYNQLDPRVVGTVAQVIGEWAQGTGQYFELLALQGLVALEQGDTDLAYRKLDAALRLAGPAHFPDRRVAERYHDLLARQRR